MGRTPGRDYWSGEGSFGKLPRGNEYRMLSLRGKTVGSGESDPGLNRKVITEDD